MFNKLRQFVEERIADANPLDGGKTAQTVRQSRNNQPAVTPPAVSRVVKPKQNLWNKATDVLDANSAMDRYKRTQRGVPSLYQDAERLRGVASRSININPAQRAVNFTRATVEGIAEAPLALGRGVGNAFATQSRDYKLAQESEDIARDVNTNTKIKMYNVLKDPNASEAQRRSAYKVLDMDQYTGGMNDVRTKIASENDPRRLAASATSLALDLATLGVASATKQGVKSAYQGAKATQVANGANRTRQVTTGLVAGGKRLATDTAKTSAMGGASGGLSAYIQDPNATAKQSLSGVGTGALMGGALPLTIAGVSSLPEAGRFTKTATTNLASGTKTAVQKPITTLKDNYIIPPSRLNPDEVAGLSMWRQIAGTGQTMTPEGQTLYQRAMSAAKKAGINPYSNREIDDLVQAHRSYDMNKPFNQGGFVANPFYKDGTIRPGVNKDQIFDGVDDKPRVEFDDSGAKIANPDGKTLGEVLDHQDLFKQYPELKNTPVEYDMRGDLQGAAGAITEKNGRTGVLINPWLADKPDRLKSTLIHEIQHNIQKIEGFARGANPELALSEFNKQYIAKYGKTLNDIDNAIQDIRQNSNYRTTENELNKLYKQIFDSEGATNPALESRAKMLENKIAKQNEELSSLIRKKREIESTKIDDMTAYQRQAGEAESRAVEARLNMTPEQRAKTPFYASLDVPREDLIIRNSDDNISLNIDTPQAHSALAAFNQLKSGKTKKAVLARLTPNATDKVSTALRSNDFNPEARLVAIKTNIEHLDNSGHITGTGKNGKIDTNPLTDSDIKALPEVFGNPDTVRLSVDKGRNGEPRLIFEKQLDNQHRLVAEVIYDGDQFMMHTYFNVNKKPSNNGLSMSLSESLPENPIEPRPKRSTDLLDNGTIPNNTPVVKGAPIEKTPTAALKQEVDPIFGQDGKAWVDYNKRYSGLDMETAKTQAEFDGVSSGDPKYFDRTPDAKRLQDVISGDKRVGYVDNRGYDSLFAQKAKEAGLYTKEWNGVTVAGKNKADVERYIAQGQNLSKVEEHKLIGYKHDSYNQAHAQPTPKVEAPKGAPIEKTPQFETYYRGEGKNQQVANAKTIPDNQFGDGVYMTPNKDYASKYGDVREINIPKNGKYVEVIRDISPEGVGTLYGKDGAPLEVAFNGIGKYWDGSNDNIAISKWARANGYDGIKVYKGDKLDNIKVNEVVVFDKAKTTPVTAPIEKTPQFGDAKAIKQVKTDAKAGAILESKNDRIANKAMNTAQPNATSMFDQNELLKKNAQADIFSTKPTVQDALAGKDTRIKIDPEMQEVIDAANQSIKDGDFETAKLLGDTLPEEYSAKINKQVQSEIDRVEADLVNSVTKELKKESLNSVDSSVNDNLLQIANKLAKHFNAPRATHKITGFKRTYNTPSGSLKVGGNAKDAIDNIFLNGDIATFTKNINILADKFGGTFREISDTIKNGGIDGADYNILTKELYERFNKRPSYRRGNSTAIQGGTTRNTNPAQSSVADVANPQTTVRQPRVVPQIDERANITKTSTTPPTKPPKPPVDNTPPLIGAGKQKKTRFADKTIPESEFVSKPIKDATKEGAPLYTPKTEKDGMISAVKRLKSQGDDSFELQVRNSLDKPDGTISRQEAIDAQVYAAKLEELGDELNISKASEIYDKLSAHYTKAGQLIQAAAMMSRRTPQGMRNYAMKKLEKAGITITPKIKSEIDTAVAQLKKTKPDTDARAQALDDLMHTVAKNTPMSKADQFVNVWRANLLTAPTTTLGGFVGNVDNLLTRKLWVNPIGSMVDMAQSLFTGKRGLTIAPKGSAIKGAGEGMGEIFNKRYWKTGYDSMDAVDGVGKYDNPRHASFGDSAIGKVAGGWTNTIYRTMGAVDKPYRYGARNEALASIAKAEAINKGLKGSQRSQFIKEFMANPPEDVMNRAIKEGRYNVFQDETALGSAIGGVSQRFKQKGWNNAAAVVDFIVPFKQIPGSIATRIVKRTPIGTANEIVKQFIKVKKKGEPYDQRAMSQAIAEGFSAAPIVGAGYALAAAGLLTGGYPSDEKERKLWQAEGKQPNSVKVGDRWYSLNYIQPFGAILNIGAGAHQAAKDGKDSMEQVWAGIAEAGKSVSDMSFLQGVSGAIDAIKKPEMAAERFVSNTASSTVPNFIRSFAAATDDYERQAVGIKEGVQSAIPGLRQQLPAKKDAFGNDVPTKDNFLNRYVNPLKPSVARNDGITTEIRRLQDSELGTMPTESNAKVFGDSKPLDKKQLNELNAFTAQKVSTAWNDIVKTTEYKNLSDEDKKKTLDSAKEDYNAVAKAEWAAKNNKISDEWQPDLTAKQKSLASGNAPDYIYAGLPKDLNQSAKKLLTESDGKDEQWNNTTTKEKIVADNLSKWLPNKIDLPPITNATAKKWAEFEKKRAEGTMGKLEAESEKKTILRDVFNSQLNEDEKDLYKLSKARLLDAYERGVINDENVNKALAVEKQLYDAGLIDSETLRKKLGLSSRSKSGSYSRSSTGTRSKKAKAIKSRYDLTKLFAYSPVTLDKSLRELVEQASKW